MLEIGRLCIKTAGRDAMQHCVVVEIIDDNYVLVDGNTRRKNVNKAHIEPLNQVLKIKKGATTKDVFKAFKEASIEITKPVEAKKRTAPKAQVTKEEAKKSEKQTKKTKK